MRGLSGAALVVFGLIGVALAQPPVPPPCAACVTLVVEPGQVLALPPPLNGLRVAVRVAASTGTSALQTLKAIRDSGGAPGILVAGAPSSPVDEQLVRMSQHLFFDITAESVDTPAAADALAFRLKTRLSEARGLSRAITLAIVVTPAQREILRSRDLAAYVDSIAETVGPDGPRPEWPDVGSAYAIIQRPDAPAQDPAAAGNPGRWLWLAPRDVVDASALARDLARAMPWLVMDLVRPGAFELSCAGHPVLTYLNPATLDTVALARGCATRQIEVKPQAIAERIVLSTGDVIVRVRAAEGQFAEDVRVVGARGLTAQEIVARHQAAAARQRLMVQALISTGSMTLTFEAPGFPALVVISSGTAMYQAGGQTEIEQRSVRVNGIEFKGGGIPRLPIIEPERAASPPLAIALSDVYRYVLSGQERVDGTACYVIAFEPAGDKQSLFRGRAWIAADSFAMVKVAAAQTGLRGPIVSSEQVDEFVQQQPEGVWLLRRSEVRQLYEGAGHRTPIHRVLDIVRHEINSPDFERRREVAYRSAAIMLRDTPDGFRYLKRDRTGGPSASAEPVVSDAAHRVRTLALGLILDPNISRPLPFAGLSYVDFNLFGTGTQVNAFFGGTYAQVAFSTPSLAGSRWQLAGRAFGIASSYNDRAFVDGREIYDRNIRQRPAHASVWTLRPVTPVLTLRAGYEIDYTQFAASELTAGSFMVPADQVAHSARVTFEGQRRGWSGGVWWAGSRRSGWRPWGTGPPDYAAADADYQRYGASVARPFVFTPNLVARVEAAWMSGRDLDRFSRYAFGTFDNRLRGYPSALIRYDRGAVLRTAGAWAVAPRLRVDGFLDTAYVLDPGFGSGFRSYTGVGGAIEVPAPFGLLAAAEWGYGFQGVNASGRRGTHVVRLSAFKIF